MKRHLFFLRILMVGLILWVSLSAEARIYIPIDQPSDKSFPIAVCDLAASGGGKGAALFISEVIRHDLDLSGYFKIISPEVYQEAASQEGTALDEIRFSYWTALEVQALIKGSVGREKDRLVITLRLFDPFIPQMLVGKQYKGTKKELREIAHRFSDEVFLALTGQEGVFLTKIAYTVPHRKGKQVYIMDLDGENNYRLTDKKHINLSPAWSPNGDQIVYTSYATGYPELFVSDLSGKYLKKITSGPGAKITPAWSPDSRYLVFGSSASGVTNLYVTTPDGTKTQHLTHSEVIDFNPAWSPDSLEIIFASERAGNLHLFKMSSQGTNIKRLTFVGYQNDMPAWSPQGDKIAFAGRDMGNFDIFIMNSDGSQLQRLTIDTGSNENPSWSPNGRFLVFSSTRDGFPALYLMRADGSHQTRISKEMGTLPQWGPRFY